MSAEQDATPQRAATCLRGWLISRLNDNQRRWLDGSALPEASDRQVYLSIALTPRRVGKADLDLTRDELVQAAAARPGWHPEDWTIDQAGRLYILLNTSSGSEDVFQRRLETLCETADVGEQVMLYRGLPLYPQPAGLKNRAAEGIRTNIKAVFEAVAHRNPYPMEWLDEAAWNQMVLKALFVDSRLHPILGIDSRANADLARTLRQYAHERWSAGRPVSPELWRCVGPFADDDESLADLARAWETGVAVEREGVALALKAAPHEKAEVLLGRAPSLAEAVRKGDLTWQTVFEKLQAQDRSRTSG